MRVGRGGVPGSVRGEESGSAAAEPQRRCGTSTIESLPPPHREPITTITYLQQRPAADGRVLGSAQDLLTYGWHRPGEERHMA